MITDDVTPEGFWLGWWMWVGLVDDDDDDESILIFDTLELKFFKGLTDVGYTCN